MSTLREHKPIDGVIADVSEPTRHSAGGYRVRFKLNGVLTDRYRIDKKEAATLAAELHKRAQAATAGISLAPTWLNPSQIKQAELSFQILANAKLVDLDDETTYSRLPFAATKLCEAVAAQGTPVMLGDGYRLFLAKQEKRLSKSTLKDYKFFFSAFVAEMGEKVLIAEITPETCHTFIYSLKSRSARFKCYGYFAAFFAFCRGKFNPHIGPNNKPWIPASPMNFERPALKVNSIVSYTLAEIRTLLSVAKEKGSLGFVVFRLFSMARYDETLRFISKGSSNFATNPFVDLENGRIHFDAEVYQKRSKGENRGRYITIEPTFASWIRYFKKHEIWFAYNRWNEEQARRAIPEKFGDGFDNLLRHTAITMHLKKFGDIMRTAVEAGTSPQIIQDHYYNVNVSKGEANGLYLLTPAKMGWR